MRHYTQLAQEQRYQIFALMKAGNSQTEIARIVSVHKSTVSRELRRNCGGRGYRPRQAHRLALKRRQDKAQARLTMDDWNRIEVLLREDWSPEQVSLWLAKEKLCRVRHEWIYRHIYQDRASGAICISTFAAASGAGSAMAVTAAEVSCQAVFVLTGALQSLRAVAVWETGNSTHRHRQRPQGRAGVPVRAEVAPDDDWQGVAQKRR